jgi:hypothetical protein
MSKTQWRGDSRSPREKRSSTNDPGQYSKGSVRMNTDDRRNQQPDSWRHHGKGKNV